MPLKIFKFLLFDKDKRPLVVNDKNFVMQGTEDYMKEDSTEDASLKFSPDQWTQTKVKYARNLTYYGLFRDMVNSLKFVKDGRRILSWIFWQYGVEAICWLGILKLDRYSIPSTYESWYLSNINFSKFNQSQTYVQVEVLEAGLYSLLKANEDTIYDIPVDSNPDAKNLLADGIHLNVHGEFLVADGGGEGINYDLRNHFTELDEIQFETTSALSLKAVLRTKFTGTNLDLPDRPEWFFQGTVTGNMRIDYRFTEGATLAVDSPLDPSGSTHIVIQVVNDGVVDLTRQVSIFAGLLPAAGRLFEGVVNIPIKPGDFFYFRTFFTVIGATGDGIISYRYYDVENSHFIVDAQYIFPESFVKGLWPEQVMDGLMQNIIGDKMLMGSAPFWTSDFLRQRRDILFMSGDNIRNIKDGVLSICWKDFYKAMSHWCIGLGIDNYKFVMEQLPYFFRNNEIILELGEVLNASVAPAEDQFFNRIITGGPEVDYDDFNGKYEPNQGQVWTTVYTKIIKDLDLSTKVRRDPYGFEFTRINLDHKTSTDSQSDNDPFMVNIETAPIAGPDFPYYKFNRPAYSEVDGVPPDAKLFNLELSPKRTILNNAPIISSQMDLQEGSLIELASGDKNTDLKTVLGSVTIEEKAPIQAGTLPGKLWRPYYIKFTTQVPFNLLPLVDAKPYGKVGLTVYGRKYYGFLFDGSIQPGDNDTQDWTVLSVIDNDFKNFYEPR